MVEGARAVADALAAGAQPRLLLLREGEDAAFAGLAAGGGAEVRVVAPRLFDDLAETVSPQGVLAVVPFPDPRPPAAGSPLALVLDRIRDPGNLGTLLRAAAGAGVAAVFLSAESVDPFNPKAVPAGMGAHFSVSLRPFDEAVVAELRATYLVRAVGAADAAAA